jgi:hypothetical protein
VTLDPRRRASRLFDNEALFIRPRLAPADEDFVNQAHWQYDSRPRLVELRYLTVSYDLDRAFERHVAGSGTTDRSGP